MASLLRNRSKGSTTNTENGSEGAALNSRATCASTSAEDREAGVSTDGTAPDHDSPESCIGQPTQETEVRF